MTNITKKLAGAMTLLMIVDKRGEKGRKVNGSESGSKPKVKVELIDKDYSEGDFGFYFITSEMSDDATPCRRWILKADMIQFVKDFEINATSMPDDEFLMDLWDEIADRYWEDILGPQITKEVNHV